MKLGGREGKNLDKKDTWRTITSWLRFSVCMVPMQLSAVVCVWDFGLLLQISSGRTGSARPLHSRGEMAVGQERMRSPLAIESQRLSPHSVGIAGVRKKPCWLQSEEHSCSSAWRPVNWVSPEGLRSFKLREGLDTVACWIPSDDHAQGYE